MLVETIGDISSSVFVVGRSSLATLYSWGGQMVVLVSLSRIPLPSGFMGQVRGMGGTREREVSP